MAPRKGARLEPEGAQPEESPVLVGLGERRARGATATGEPELEERREGRLELAQLGAVGVEQAAPRGRPPAVAVVAPAQVKAVAEEPVLEREARRVLLLSPSMLFHF